MVANMIIIHYIQPLNQLIQIYMENYNRIPTNENVYFDIQTRLRIYYDSLLNKKCFFYCLLIKANLWLAYGTVYFNTVLSKQLKRNNFIYKSRIYTHIYSIYFNG